MGRTVSFVRGVLEAAGPEEGLYFVEEEAVLLFQEPGDPGKRRDRMKRGGREG